MMYKKNAFVALIFVFLLAGINAHAQGNLDDLLGAIAEEKEAGKRDAGKLVEGYISPFIKGFGYGLVSGWNNTAKPHKKFGVELTITANLSYVPDKDLLYNVGDMDLETVSLESSADDPNVPTVFGPNYEPVYRYNATNTTFNGPPGGDLEGEIGSAFVPVPMVHLGFGLPWETDIKVRFLPNISTGEDTKMNMWGVGLLHDFKQHIPVMKNMPFSLSVFAGYTRLNVETDLNSTLPQYNQRALFGVNGFTAQVLISKKLSVVTFYGGLGYNAVSSNLDMKGQYDLNDDNIYDPVTDIEDPLSLKYSTGGARATIGFRLKLSVITLHTDYTFQEYNTLSVGFGINVRD